MRPGIQVLNAGRRQNTPLEQLIAAPPPFELSKPTISLLMPYYNYGRYVRAAVDSILSCPDEERALVEVIIIDNGSTDCRDIAILHEQSQRLAGKVRNLVTHRIEEGIPLGYVRNLGARMATGDFYCWVDPDDEVVPGRFHHTLQASLAHMGQKIVYGDAWSKNGIAMAYMMSMQLDFPALLKGCGIYCQSTLMPRWMYMALGGQTDLKIAEDYEFWLRAAGLGLQYQQISRPLYIARAHDSNKTLTDMTNNEAWHATHKGIREAAIAIRDAGIPFIAVKSRFAADCELACGRMGTSHNPNARQARIFIDFMSDNAPHLPRVIPQAIWEAWRDIETNRLAEGREYSNQLERGYSPSADATVMFNLNDIGQWSTQLYRTECVPASQ